LCNLPGIVCCSCCATNHCLYRKLQIFYLKHLLSYHCKIRWCCSYVCACVCVYFTLLT
jgi:hypothetical protein